MDIQQFAENHSLKISRDSCGAPIVQGKYSHIFEGYADGRLGVLFVAPTARNWNNARKKMEAAGFITKQNGETEGALSFDPADKAQVLLANVSAPLISSLSPCVPLAVAGQVEESPGSQRKPEASTRM